MLSGVGVCVIHCQNIPCRMDWAAVWPSIRKDTAFFFIFEGDKDVDAIPMQLQKRHCS